MNEVVTMQVPVWVLVIFWVSWLFNLFQTLGIEKLKKENEELAKAALENIKTFNRLLGQLIDQGEGSIIFAKQDSASQHKRHLH